MGGASQVPMKFKIKKGKGKREKGKGKRNVKPLYLNEDVTLVLRFAF